MKSWVTSFFAFSACFNGATRAFNLVSGKHEAKSAGAYDRRNFLSSVTAAVVGLSCAPGQGLAFDVGGKIRFGDESIMSPKEHGTSSKPVQSDLLYGVSNKLADKICNYNRYAVLQDDTSGGKVHPLTPPSPLLDKTFC